MQKTRKRTPKLRPIVGRRDKLGEWGKKIIEGLSTVVVITPLIMSFSINIVTVVVAVVTQYFGSITRHCDIVMTSANEKDYLVSILIIVVNHYCCF